MTHYKIDGKKTHDANNRFIMLAYGTLAILAHNAKDSERFGDIVTVKSIG